MNEHEGNLNSDNISFLLKYKPASVDELCMHPKKIKDVKQVLFDDMLKNDKYKILLLTGPSGTCKTTMIKLLIKQYYSTHRSEFSSFTINSKSGAYNETDCLIEYDSLDKSCSFKDFLDNCKVFKKSTSMMKFVIIKHLPNIYYPKAHAEFLKSISEWLDEEADLLLPPIVLIISECDIPKSITDDISGNNYNYNKFDINSHYIPETIFNREILAHPKLKRVNTNKIAKTYLKKELTKVLKNEVQLTSKNKNFNQYQRVIENLSNLGDLPSALIQLEQYIHTPLLFSKDSVEDTNKDLGLSIFHAIGKIVYGTKENNVSNEDIITKLCKNYQQYTDSIFKMSVLENIDKGCSDIAQYSELLESFSQTDMMDYKLGTEVYLRKIRQSMNTNSSGKKSVAGLKFTPFFKVYKKKQQSLREYRDFQSMDGMITENYKSLKDVILWSSFYDPVIKSFYYNKYKAWKEYRLSAGKNSLNYLGPGPEIDPQITYLNKLGGEYGYINSVNDIDIQDTNSYYFVSKYEAYMRKNHWKTRKEKGFYDHQAEKGDLPYDSKCDDFIIEDSSNEDSDFDSSDDEELFKLTSQTAPKVTLKDEVNSSKSYDSDEELFQLTSQHLQNVNKFQKK